MSPAEKGGRGEETCANTERGRKGEKCAAHERTHTRALEECVALAWERDAEHVLDRVYRVTDLRAHHNASSPSPCPPPARPSSGTLRRGPPARARARLAPRPLCPYLNATPSHAHARVRRGPNAETMRDLARSPFFATIVRAVLITRDAQHTGEIDFRRGGG